MNATSLMILLTLLTLPACDQASCHPADEYVAAVTCPAACPWRDDGRSWDGSIYQTPEAAEAAIMSWGHYLGDPILSFWFAGVRAGSYVDLEVVSGGAKSVFTYIKLAGTSCR